MACTLEQLRSRTADPEKQPGDCGVQREASLLIAPVEPLIDHEPPPDQ